MALIEINGMDTRYEVMGDGPPLLMYSPGGFDARIEQWTDLGVYKRIKLLDHLPEAPDGLGDLKVVVGRQRTQRHAQLRILRDRRRDLRDKAAARRPRAPGASAESKTISQPPYTDRLLSSRPLAPPCIAAGSLPATVEAPTMRSLIVASLMRVARR